MRLVRTKSSVVKKRPKPLTQRRTCSVAYDVWASNIAGRLFGSLPQHQQGLVRATILDTPGHMSPLQQTTSRSLTHPLTHFQLSDAHCLFVCFPPLVDF